MDKEFKDAYDLEFSQDDDIPEEDLTEEQKRLRDLQGLTNELSSERTEAINNKRESIDGRLTDAARLYKGVQDASGRDSLAEQFDTPTVQSRVYHNITRQITNDGVAQLGDTLFPSDDNNYGVNHEELTAPPLVVANEPAIDSKGEQLTDAEGNPLTNQQAHNRRVERARRKAERMFRKIDSSLTLARYPIKGRKVIRDAGIYGTGIIKGPIPNKVSSRWAKKKDGTYGIKSAKELEADLKVVSPFDWFPDMSATEMDEVSYIWERTHLLPVQLQKLAVKQGFNKTAVAKLLAGGPSHNNVDSDIARETAREESFGKYLANGRFELWERHGVLKRKHLIASGVTVSSNDTYIRCVVYMIGTEILSVVEWPYAKDDQIYSIFNWDEDPLSLFGYGIPYLMNDPQHVYNTTWCMTLDNAGIAALPQVVIDKMQIKPADGTGNYALQGGKAWERTGEQYSMERNDKPFEIFEIRQNIQFLFALMDRAVNDAYELTGVTRVDKTQQMNDNAPVTLGATQIQQNNSSVSRRAQVRRYDDQITSTLITRFYDFFMQFEADDDIKAAMVIDPRGTTVLLSKELQASNLMQFFQMTEGGNTEGVKQMDLLRAISSSMQHSAGQFLDTDEELGRKAEEASQQEPEVDPMIAIEDRKVAVQEAQVELAQADLQMKGQIEQAQLQLEYAKLDVKQQDSIQKGDIEISKINLKGTLDGQKQQLQEGTKRELGAAKISSDMLKDRSAVAKGERELSIRDREVGVKEQEIHHKVTTGQDGI